MKKLKEHKEEILLYVLVYAGGTSLLIGGFAAFCAVTSTILRVLGLD